ncbi:hypothetical protein EXIGLDRAFT_671542 [Exidia glandulosa HHB12029]|uniref:E2 ubiquitin-conjugating enzyme n=1 Tax=Exidia glandulosa HHB12029 TaxID=1314781 RepID=A0A166AX83_EXIGL|nr:hypothetical protein EXIGLDRAFT_671542 [Exidia glandulosa HHB12029]
MASSQMQMAKKRIHKEWADIQKEDLGKMSLAPKDDDMFQWDAVLPGPEGSVYEGGMFAVSIQLPQDYPFTPPKATFKTRIYHCNISDSGNICIDILKTNWSPALSLLKVLLSLSSLLSDPNPKDPLVPVIATQYMRQRKKHDETAREWTRLYALPKVAPAPPPPAPPKAASGRSTRTSGPRGGVARVIEILDDDEIVALPSTSTGRRRRDAEEASQPSRKRKKASGTSASGGAGGMGAAGGSSSNSQDVIVID